MPGYELFDHREREAVDAIFAANGGVLFAHGFDAIRNGVYKVREYERAFATYFGFPYAQAVASGSAAVRLALECSGVRPGDEVIIPAHTFIATAEAVLQVGATPVVVDIDESLNMSPAAMAAAIGPRTRAVIPVHMMGEMADMDAITLISTDCGITIVEDCAQALGATLGGRPAGSFGKASAFSTDAGKTLCTGEGGFVATSDERCFVDVRARHDHGHAYDDSVPRGLDPVLTTGFNYRLTELQAAIGLVQLEKLEEIIQRQRTNKALIMERVSALPISFRTSIDPAGDIGDTIVMILDSAESASQLAEHLGGSGYGTKNLPSAMRWHFAEYWPHLLGECDGRWKQSKDILERSVALGVSALSTKDEIARICDAVERAVLETSLIR